MTPHSIDTPGHDDDFDARTQRISGKILDGIEETLAELAQPRALHAAIEQIVRSQCAALLCRQAMCRRANRCRRQPCMAPDAGFPASDSRGA